MICILMKQYYYLPYLQHLHTFLSWMFFKFTHFMRAIVKKYVVICNFWKIVLTFASDLRIERRVFCPLIINLNLVLR